jgi:hypothetical protein
MNKKILLTSRLFVTILVAGLVSAVVGVIFLFIFSNLGMSSEDSMAQSGWISSVVLGLLVGYRLNDLLRQNKS